MFSYLSKVFFAIVLSSAVSVVHAGIVNGTFTGTVSSLNTDQGNIFGLGTGDDVLDGQALTGTFTIDTGLAPSATGNPASTSYSTTNSADDWLTVTFEINGVEISLLPPALVNTHRDVYFAESTGRNTFGISVGGDLGGGLSNASYLRFGTNWIDSWLTSFSLEQSFAASGGLGGNEEFQVYDANIGSYAWARYSLDSLTYTYDSGVSQQSSVPAPAIIYLIASGLAILYLSGRRRLS